MADEKIDQDDIEKLLAQSARGLAKKPSPPQEGLDASALDQSEIEALLQGGSPPPSEPRAPTAPATPAVPTATAAPPQPTAPPPTSAAPEGEGIAQNDIEFLLNQAQEALASIDQPADNAISGAQTFQFRDFAGSPATHDKASIDLLREVQLDVKIELGRTHMQLDEVLKLGQGAVVALDKLAGDPVDIYVNGRLIARGEVLVLNDNFCVRVAELIVGDSAVA